MPNTPQPVLALTPVCTLTFDLQEIGLTAFWNMRK
jgi:hypothetical protein